MIILALTNEQKEKVKIMRLEGYGYRIIANELQVERNQIRDYCRLKSVNLGGDVIKASKYKSKEYLGNATCKSCGCQYQKKSANSKYCCVKCTPSLSNSKIEKELNCVYCKIDFKSFRKKKYCSVSCREKANNRISVEFRKCETCEKEFSVSRTDSRRKFCSTTCSYKTIKCLGCEVEFKTRIEGKKYCNNNCRKKSVKKTHEQFTTELQAIHKGLIVPMELYKGSDYKMKFKCLQCDLEFEKIARHSIGAIKTGCPSCKRPSKGEDSIRDFLKKNKINFEEQKGFEGLKYLSALFYDFAVYDSKENLECLIEFDGEQHFRSVEKWGGEEKLAETILRDEIKNNYASTNGIDLLRISYKDINKIEEILECKFKETLLERG